MCLPLQHNEWMSTLSSLASFSGQTYIQYPDRLDDGDVDDDDDSDGSGGDDVLPIH